MSDAPPAGWSRARVDWLMDEVRDSIGPEQLAGREVFHYSIPALAEFGDGVVEDGNSIASSKPLLKGGELLVSKLNPRKSHIVIARAPVHPTVCSGEFIVLRPRACDARFMFYVFSSEVIRQELDGRVQSVTKSHQRVGPDDITKLWVSVPSLEAQCIIADFLDRETASLDELANKKRALVDLCLERERALVSLLVGDGRRSGAWQAGSFKRVTSRVDVGIAEAATHAYTHQGVPLLRSSNIRPNHIDDRDLLFIQPWFAERNRSKYVRAGDILTVRTGSPGVSAVVPAHLDMSQCFTQLISTVKPPHSPEFFAYVLNSDLGRGYFASAGWGSAQANISVPLLSDAPVPVPAPEEQRRIVRQIRGACDPLRRLQGKLDEQIQFLGTRRQALITAAITGQIEFSGKRPDPNLAVC